MDAEIYCIDRVSELSIMERIFQEKVRKQELILQIESIEDQDLLNLLEELNKAG